VTARSWLFVPGDSERKQAKAAASAADALILDLEDSVAPGRRGRAREQVQAFLRSRQPRGAQRLWVRVNGLASGELLDDLAAVMAGAPDGIVLPKISSVEEVLEVHHYLSALEQREQLARESTGLLVIATETPQAVLGLGRFAALRAGGGHPVAGAEPAAGRQPPFPRLVALTWGVEDLAAALGVREKGAADGTLTLTFDLARSLCVLAAAAAGVQAIDGVHAEFADGRGLARELERARRDGFTGKLAVHPDQVEPINAAFTPTESEISHARRIVAAFAASPDVGVTSIDGKMVDRPHLLQAQRLLAAAEALGRK
jgi:citrate lyase subunit beta / citryl-CoA lyase